MKERPPGRSLGYKHSEKTKQKMREAHRGQHKNVETRQKISDSMRGQSKSEEHRENISQRMLDNQTLDIDRLCRFRLAELKENYPDQAKFFEENEASLLIALRDVKSDKEIDDISRYIETENIARYVGTLSYQYSSSSIYAHEDAVITLIDTVAYLRKFH